MIALLLKEIERALKQVVILAPAFKREILTRARDLKEEPLGKLDRILKDIIEYEKNEIEKRLKIEPDYFVKLAERATKKRQLKLKRRQIAQEALDKEKIEELTKKIKQVI